MFMVSRLQDWLLITLSPLKILVLSAIAAVASAAPAAPTYGYKPIPAPAPAYIPAPAPAPAYVPAPAPAPAYKPAPAPAYKPAPAPVYPDVAPAYKYTYGVDLADTLHNAYGEGAYGHSEARDGYATTGEYRVALPDGRTQIVSYKADKNGYVADVRYEGVAKYPEYKPAYHPAPAPAYAPAPAPVPTYKPAPVAPAAAAAEEAPAAEE